MFTIVNSKRKDSEPSINLEGETSSLKNSTLTSFRFAILSRLSNLFKVNDDFFKLQLSVFCLTFALSIVIAFFGCFFVSTSFGISLLIGSLIGVLYLRLLAKSIANLCKGNVGVSKIQLLLPVCLFIIASKNEFLEILPAIIGFFLYKPALIIYFSRS